MNWPLFINDRYFATVCFRLIYSSDDEIYIDSTGDEVINGMNNEINKRLLEMINASGKIYMTHAVIGSRSLRDPLCSGAYFDRGVPCARCMEGGASVQQQHHTNVLLSHIRD